MDSLRILWVSCQGGLLKYRSLIKMIGNQASYETMNKYATLIQALEGDISLIRNKNDYQLSIDAFIGHKKRYLEEIELISKKLRKGKVLDIGASPYHIMYCLKKLGFDIYGIDIDPNILKGFQRKYGLKVIKHNIEKGRSPFKDEEFDLVIFTEIFEHLGVDPLGVLREIRRILKPSGILILSTPNLYTLHKIIMFLFGRSFNEALGELKKVESAGYIGHIREYSNKEIKMILESCGYNIKEVYFKKYTNFFLAPSIVRKTPLFFLGLMFEFITDSISFLRPTQIVIAEKRV